MAAYGVDPYGRPNLTDQINSQNSTADPSKPYVQAGTTGGYIDGIGVTVGPGSSLTPEQAQNYYKAGVAKYGQSAVDDFLARNPNDYARIDSGLADLLAPKGSGNGSSGSSGANSSQSAGSGIQYPTYTPYQFTQRTLPTYTPAQLAQYSAPSSGNVMPLEQSLVEQVLTNPETMSPDVVAALKEKNKEEALTYQDQQNEMLGRDAVARGVTVNPGDARRLASDVISQLITGNRNIDIQKATQDRADQQSAAALAEQFLTGLTNRAQSNYDSTLKGETAQEALNQAAVQSQIQQILNDEQQQQAQADENHFAFGTQADAANFGQNQYAFNTNNALALAQLAEQIRQFNNTLGFNYTTLGANLQAAIPGLVNSYLNS